MSSTGRKLFVSFTGLLRELAYGTVTPGDLTIGYFMFGCSREHAFEPWKDGPNELTWFWKIRPEEGERVHAMLAEALICAELEHRVMWRDDLLSESRHQITKMARDSGMDVIQ